MKRSNQFSRQIETEFYPNELTGNDWQARLDLQDDSVYGYGKTELQAIRNLFKDLLAEEFKLNEAQ